VCGGRLGAKLGKMSLVKQGIVLGHVIFERGIEVDKAKVEIVEQLPPPKDVKSLRNAMPTFLTPNKSPTKSRVFSKSSR
jgi:hypothetical protein